MGVRVVSAAIVGCLFAAGGAPVAARVPPVQGQTSPVPGPGQAEPQDYVIGVGDILLIGVWREDNLGGEVVVRPDGKISVNLINEIDAAGLTTGQLRDRLTEAFTKFFTAPTVMLQLKEINSRMVFVQGQVGKPGPYPLLQPLTISMLLAIAGGPSEYADKSHIVVIRHGERRPDGTPISFAFNYRDFERRRNLKQDILLKPGDVVIVPGG
jgi:polysaccharide export outer membrane protein